MADPNCPTCHGEGFTDEGTCPDCAEPSPPTLDPNLRPCPDCKAAGLVRVLDDHGQVVAASLCTRCEGRGWVSPQTPTLLPDLREQARMGRPSKLTPVVMARLVAAIEMGSTYELACSYAGISYSTFRAWQVRAEKPRAPQDYLAFLEAVKRAKSNAAVKWLLKIEQAASKGSWQAAAWKLERLHSEYRRKVDVYIDDQMLDEFVQVAGRFMSADQLAKFKDALREAAEGGE